MKKVLLIGDSVRQGYDAYVKEKLVDVAEVVYPKENCMYATNVLRFLHEWASNLSVAEELDVIHWNTGLWDSLRMFGEEPLTPVNVYAELITRIQKRIQRLFPHAISIFATTSPVLEHHLWPEPDKLMLYNSEIEQYNAAAVQALAPFDVKINDLYGLLKDIPESYHSDPIHYYTPQATQLIGDAVCAHILASLGSAYVVDNKVCTEEHSPNVLVGI